MTEEYGFGSIPGVEGDVTKVENNYKNWEDGEYKARGIHSYVSNDKDRGLPIFVVQGDKLVARFKLLILTNDEETGTEIEAEGPPMSTTITEMRMLVRAFGGDPSKLPAEGTTKFLQDAMDMINSARQTKRAGVKNGWVKWVEGQNPPTGKDVFLWQFKGFWCEKGTNPVAFEVLHRPSGLNGAYDEDIAWAKFELIADAWGNPSPYAGYEISIKVYNPYNGSTKEQGGKLFPATNVGAKGGIPVGVSRWLHFLTLYTMPDYANRWWESDPEKSDFGVNEFDNPLVVVNHLALASKRLVVASLSTGKTGGVKLNLDDLGIYKGQPIDLDQQQAEADAQPSALYEFVEYAEKAAGIAIFKPTAKGANEINLDFTDDGKVWAKDKLVPAWNELELPIENGKRFVGKLSDAELVKLTNYLRRQNGEVVIENPDLSEAEGVDSF